MTTNTEKIEVLRPLEIARTLKVSKSLVYRWISEGDLPSLDLPGNVIRVLKQDFDQFVNVSRVKKRELTD